MEIKALSYGLSKGYSDRDVHLNVSFGDHYTQSILTLEELEAFLSNPFTHFHIGHVDAGISTIIYNNLVCFSKMELVNYLYQRIQYIDYLQLQFSASYTYDATLEKIKFSYVKFAKELMKMPSQLKYISSSLGQHLNIAYRGKSMTPWQLKLFRDASSTFMKIRELFNKNSIDFHSYKIGIMSNSDMTKHVYGVVFNMSEINGVHLLGVLGESNANSAVPSAPKIREVIMREENVKDKHGKDEKRERIYIKYQ